MAIGYHDRNLDSGFRLFYLEARERNVPLRDYDSLPNEREEDFPEAFFINPPAIPSQGADYWENMRRCIAAHPNTRFLVFGGLSMEREELRKLIGSPTNLEYLGVGEGKKLLDLLDGSKAARL